MDQVTSDQGRTSYDEVSPEQDLAIREEIAKGIRILVRERLVVNFGHISVRLPGANWFWTLRHLHIGLDSIGTADVIRCDMDGRSLEPTWEASGERFIYTEVFKKRLDVKAVAHFHPPMGIAFSIAGHPIVPTLMWAASLGQ